MVRAVEGAAASWILHACLKHWILVRDPAWLHRARSRDGHHMHRSGSSIGARDVGGKLRAKLSTSERLSQGHMTAAKPLW